MLARLAVLSLIAASPALAQSKKAATPTPTEAAAAFTLDTSAMQGEETRAVDETPPTPATEPSPAEEPAPPVEAPAPAETAKPAGAALSLDTPIGELIADPHGRAVLDKDLPGLSTDSNLAKFAKLNLRQFQPLTGGQLTDALLGEVERDLAAPPARPAAKKPAKSRRTER